MEGEWWVVALFLCRQGVRHSSGPFLYVEEIGMEFDVLLPQMASMVAVSAGSHVLE